MSTVETDPPKAQRHLAAILATDVVRSSWHMERKEAETILRLRDLRQNLIEPKVAEHRGRVFKTMGDGFLAEFVSALDAVHCAVDIQRLMTERNLDLAKDDRLELRIGINLGDVFREGDDVVGDGVNVAARLEASAPAGGIRVSRSVCDPIRDRFTFDFDDLGEHQFHNITRPIHVFGVRIEGAAEVHLRGMSIRATHPNPRRGHPLVAGIAILAIIALCATLALGYHYLATPSPIEQSRFVGYRAGPDPESWFLLKSTTLSSNPLTIAGKIRIEKKGREVNQTSVVVTCDDNRRGSVMADDVKTFIDLNDYLIENDSTTGFLQRMLWKLVCQR
jgi:class 3 adenylate cyclase